MQLRELLVVIVKLSDHVKSVHDQHLQCVDSFSHFLTHLHSIPSIDIRHHLAEFRNIPSCNEKVAIQQKWVISIDVVLEV